ncbi:hypothetical protein ACROYT_G037259 [Oculina patagonica]
MTQATARLVLLGFGLVLLYETPVNSRCVSMENQPSYANAPSLEISNLEFPNEDVLPTGYNITVICTSNFSKANWGNHYYGQPYWIQKFVNDDYVGDCGGGDDSEDSKVCTFVIQNSTEKNSGNYSCLTHNQITCTHGTIYLTFKEPSPPKFRLTSPRNMNVFAGSTVNLTCEATGIPRPVVTWYKDGLAVPRENISRVNEISLLTLESVEPRDQGDYWCEAHNAEGWNKSFRTSLKLFSKPTILHHPQNVSVYLEDKAIMVIFTCEASGFPRPEFTWRKEAPGKFKCVVKNSLGEVSSKEGALIIRTRIHSLDDNSTSSGVSKVLWIPIATGAVFLFVAVISICLVHNKNKKANYKIDKKINGEQRFPHLHINEDTVRSAQKRSNSPTFPNDEHGG